MPNTIGSMFAVEYGNKYDLNKMDLDPKGVSFVGRSDRNSGVTARVKPLAAVEPYEAGLLTVALGGAPLATFVQQRSFYTAQNVAVLRPRDDSMTLVERLYWAMCIRANRYRYTAFGREANRTLREVRLPDRLPDWVAEAAGPPTLDAWRSAKCTTGPLLGDVHGWPRHGWNTLFEVGRGRYVPSLQKLPGTTPLVSSTATNNGVSGFVALGPEWPGGTLTVARNGSVGQAFFQPRPYFATDDVHVLSPNGWTCTPSRGLFVAALISQEKFRYSYGRKWSLDKMRASELPLPTRSDGEVDWGYIDDFMSARSWSARTL
jgi:hypothetical protein